LVVYKVKTQQLMVVNGLILRSTFTPQIQKHV